MSAYDVDEVKKKLAAWKAEIEVNAELKAGIKELEARTMGDVSFPPSELAALKAALGAAVAMRDDPADLVMPEIGRKLLPFIVPKKRRDDVIGDLAEDFCVYAAQWGRPYALRLFWWEVAVLCVRRFGPTAIVTGIAAWFRQQLGW